MAEMQTVHVGGSKNRSLRHVSKGLKAFPVFFFSRSHSFFLSLSLYLTVPCKLNNYPQYLFLSVDGSRMSTP